MAQNPWVEGDFTWEQFIDHTGRGKGAPAFDALDLSSGENSLFGNENTNARHFTTYAQGGDLEEGVEDAVTRMNPLYPGPQPPTRSTLVPPGGCERYGYQFLYCQQPCLGVK